MALTEELTGFTSFGELVLAYRRGLIWPQNLFAAIQALGQTPGNEQYSVWESDDIAPLISLLDSGGYDEQFGVDIDTIQNPGAGIGVEIDPVGGGGDVIIDDDEFGDVGALEPVRDLTATRAGRQTLFDRAMAASQFSRFASPLVRGIQQRRFNPLSAQYVLGEAGREAGAGIGEDVIGPAQYSDFQGFLGTNPSMYTPQEFQTAIGSTRPLFTTASDDLSDPQRAARMALETAGGMGFQGPARNIITQAAMSGVSPLFQRYIPGIVGRSIDAWRHKNPQAELFKHFIDQGYDPTTSTYSASRAFRPSPI
jgi:hypothetical protein